MAGRWIEVDGATVHVKGEAHMNAQTLQALVRLAEAALRVAAMMPPAAPRPPWPRLSVPPCPDCRRTDGVRLATRWVIQPFRWMCFVCGARFDDGGKMGT